MDYQQQQGVGGANGQPFAEDPRYSGTQTFQGNVAPGSNTAAQETAYGAPDLGAEGPGPDQHPAAGSGTSRLPAVFGNSGFGAKTLQPFPTPSRPPGAVAARDYSKRSEHTEQQPLGGQIGAGVTGYGDQGTGQQSTDTTSSTGPGSLGLEPQQQNADGFDKGPPAYDEATTRDDLEQTPASGPIEDQPQLGTRQDAADHQPVVDNDPNNLNQESSMPEEMHDPVLQESQFGADEASEQTAAPSEQETAYAEPDPAQIGTGAAATMAEASQHQTQVGTGSAAEESLGGPTVSQPPVEDSLDSETMASGESRDPVEQQTEIGTNGVPGPTGSEFEQIPSDPVEGQTQLGTDQVTDDHLPVEDTSLGEQERAYAEPGNTGDGGVDRLEEPAQLGTGGAAEESLEGAGGYQQPVEGSWDSESKPSGELHDPVLQQTQLGTEDQMPSGTDPVTDDRLPAENTISRSLDPESETPHELDDTVLPQQAQVGTDEAPGQTGATPEQEAMYAEPGNIGTGGVEKLDDSTPQQTHFGNGAGPQDSSVIPSADPQQTAEGLQSSNGYHVNDQTTPGIPNTNLPTAADRTDDTVRDEIPTSEGTSVERAADPTSDTHVDNEQLNPLDTNTGKSAGVADSLKGDEVPAKLNNENGLPENGLPENEPATTADDPSTIDEDTKAPAATATAKKGMFSSLMNKILPGGSKNS